MKGDVEMIAREGQVDVGHIRLIRRDEAERLPERLGRLEVCDGHAELVEVTTQRHFRRTTRDG